MSTSDYTDISQTYDYRNLTPVASSGKSYDIFNSAMKNIRFHVPPSGVYTVRQHDLFSLPTIAELIYGDVSLWRVILAYNGLTGSLRDIVAGTVLKYPSKAAISSYLSRQSASNGGGSQSFFI